MKLDELARILDEWIAPARGVDGVELFGGRVRGDHRPDSDVDIRLYVARWAGDNPTAEWWGRENRTDFANLKARLPGPLSLHADLSDIVDPYIEAGSKNSVLVVGRCVCVWTPPKDARSSPKRNR